MLLRPFGAEEGGSVLAWVFQVDALDLDVPWRPCWDGVQRQAAARLVDDVKVGRADFGVLCLDEQDIRTGNDFESILLARHDDLRALDPNTAERHDGFP